MTDGGTVRIRPAMPEDAEVVRKLHAAMSPDNNYLRFFSLSPLNAEREAQRICRDPAPDHLALLAWSAGSLVGVASYEVLDDPHQAEVAFSVSDRMHGHGIATLLLDHLVSVARQHQILAFTAETLGENLAMLRVFADAGLPVHRKLADGVVEVVIQIPAGDGDPDLPGYLDAVSRRESYADVASLRHLLAPRSVAVIGASRRENAVGTRILRNITAGGFTGTVYPVNPHADELAGVLCARSIAHLPVGVDLAIIAIPASAVPDAAEQCGRRGVRSLVVVTSGLGETGPGLLATCRKYGMRLVGPNCFGIAVPGIGLDATFGRDRPVAGTAGLIVQSGGIGVSLTEHLSRLGIGISSFVSVGDKYDVSSNDLLAWWEQDQRTRMAILYLESFGNPRKFARTARRVGRQMPVLTVVGGRSADGQRAAKSHTAAAATPLVTREALFEQAGVIATESLGELIGTAAFLSSQPCPAGRRVAVVSNAGGAGVLAADACVDEGLVLAPLSDAVRQQLAEILPAGAATANPVDTTAAIDTAAFGDCLAAVAADEGVDAVICVIVPTAMADLTEAIAAPRLLKPLAVAVLDQAEDIKLMPGQAVPSFAYPEGAVKALSHAARYGAWRRRDYGQVPALPEVRGDEARGLVADFLRANPEGGWLSAASVGRLLDCYQIPQVTTVLASTEQEVVAAASSMGGPVVLKAQVEGLVHKTEAGAVRLDLRSTDDVTGAYQDLAAAFGDKLTGVLVQPMRSGGTEVLIGVVTEPVFGPLVVFGLGGIATDVLGDHCARLTPLTDTDARELITGVRSARLLEGYRGQPAADTAALADVLLRISRLADDLPEVAELDLNPVIARPDGCQAADARIRIVPVEPADPYLRRLR
ncbi:MAG TPA: GNAT family N-acetyltransferase [Streptosporangiaceae bacterium]|nr:GNAT family N-acetyltransferase [Streptosporangiaceae bacterium]